MILRPVVQQSGEQLDQRRVAPCHEARRQRQSPGLKGRTRLSIGDLLVGGPHRGSQLETFSVLIVDSVSYYIILLFGGIYIMYFYTLTLLLLPYSFGK